MFGSAPFGVPYFAQGPVANQDPVRVQYLQSWAIDASVFQTFAVDDTVETHDIGEQSVTTWDED